jgi:hypothetical protein
MKKVFRLWALLAISGLTSCSAVQRTTAVVKPRYHNTSPKNRWRIDIPVGARHIRFLERKRTKVVNMN